MRRFATTVLATTALLIGGLGLQPASAAGYPPCTITGTAAGETITGTEGNDVICTGGGNDTVNALGGNDIIIVSGSGIDTINGGSGNDTIDASLGTDSTIDAGSGDDTVFGTPGDDEITAGDGSDTVDGNAGDDTFTGGSGNDNLQGDIGDDTITGDTGDDTITGGDGNDTLNGTTGDDSVIGGQGVDILNGGPGSDELDGENGNDRLKGGEGDDKLLGGAGNDKLSGDSGRDKISGGEGLNVCAKDLEDENSACTYEVAFDISIAMVFSGRVLTSDGFAVPGVRVNLSNLQGSSIPGPLTDSQGRFSIPAAAGKWVVELIGYGSSEMKLPHRWTVVSSLSSAGDGLNNLLNLTQDIDADFVLPEVKKIKIQVKDSDGSPIQGAWAMDRGSCVDGQLDVRAQVYLTRSCPLGGGTYISGQSDADGNIYLYSFGYGFNVQVHFQASNGVIFEKIITIQEDNPEPEIFDTRFFNFSGRVLTSDGFAVPGVRVNLSNLQGSSIPGPLTDSQGRFSIPAAAGKWVVELIGYGSSEMKLPHRWTVVSSLSSAGDGLNNLLNLTQDIDADFVLPEVKKIKIQVKDSDGSPIQGAWAMDRGSCVDGQLDVRAQVYLTRSCPLGGGTYISGQSDADGNIYLYSFGYGFNVQVHFQASNGVIFEKIITIQDSALQTANLDTKPSAPIGVNTANVTTKSLILKWQIPEADGGLLITDYQVEVTSNGANSWSVIPHIASNSLGFNVTNLLPGRTYQFRVSAVTAAGVGAISNVITVTTLGAVGPNAPASLLVSGVKTNAASLSWSAVVATQKVSNYLVDVSTDGNTWVPVSKKVSTATSLALSGLRRGTAYQVRVAAVNSVGTGPYVYGSFTTLATVSTSPTVLVSSNVSGSRFTLNWNAPASNGGAAITDYLVEINGGGFSWAPINHEVTGNTSITVSGLNPGIKYTVRVKAVNRVGISKSSTSLYVTTLATTPGIVTGLKVKSVSATGAVITWTAPNAGGAKISDYKVEYSSDGGNTWLTVSKSASTSTSLTLKNLKTRKSYLFRVSAKNSVGYSAPSSNLIVAKP